MTRRQKMKIQKVLGLVLLVATAGLLIMVAKFFGEDADGSFAIITLPLAVALMASKRCWLSI